MFSCLLKRVLPFTLTLIIGSFLGLLFSAHGTDGRFVRMTARLEHDVPFGRGYGYGYGHSCRMHARNLVAETKPLLIHFKPDAHISRTFEGYGNSMWVRATFGAEGKVLDVQQLQTLMPEAVQQAVERAARQIQFEPEMVNGMPVSVTKEIEIHFMAD